MDEEHVDRLLERYLVLLDEYTTLRDSLGKAQTSMFQDLARANFSAERGMRYGPDYYDDRMQATRILSITAEEDGVSVFEAAESPKPETKTATSAGDAVEKGKDGGEQGEQPTTSKSKDPLRWFGILAPMPLRQAQSHAIHAIDDIIPRLVTVDAEMKHVEIQIRRARKKRAKAANAKEKVPSHSLATVEHRRSEVA